MGLINLVGGGNVTYGTAFVIGIIASLSSCMAVVGGLLLALSATFAERGEKFTPHLLFHVGRLLSFFVLGGVIGSLGAVFTLSSVTTAILSVAIGLVMLLLGVNLLNLFPEVERLIPAMPKIIAGKTKTLLALNGTLMPFLVGGATFFLPCGFTQSMQLYTLSTGSFAHGSLTMLFFALGTLPVLFAISVSAYRITAHRLSGVFFKVAGLIVIAFALLNISNSLVAFGLIAPIIQL
jgi:sulfite exporter TauE/SafE